FHRMQTWSDFREAVSKALTTPGLKIIEVPTDRQQNVAMHRAIWAAVSKTLEGARIGSPKVS
ncbi:MAG TPA: hypothetical protein VMT34_15190, partial [Aggregatilineales bacterium]|nr:hypothetical protein [Aggregatilineales bacterium]